MIPTLDMKWNDYAAKESDSLYLFNGQTLFIIREGTGDNLTYSDEEEGYKDYWITEYFDLFNNGNDDGGQWLETSLISDINYTIQGVINRIKECDLWDSNWKILDSEIGTEIYDLLNELMSEKYKFNIAKCSLNRVEDKYYKAIKKLL